MQFTGQKLVRLYYFAILTDQIRVAMEKKKVEKQTESEFLIRKRELGELFDSNYDLDINLFRGINPNNELPPLYPILKAFKLSNGRPRLPDIKTYMKNGELWVDSTSGGISLFDRIGVPVKSWEFLLLKAGTKLKLGLVITKDDYKERFDATHYTIRPQWDMPVTQFCFLLDDLATALRGV